MNEVIDLERAYRIAKELRFRDPITDPPIIGDIVIVKSPRGISFGLYGTLYDDKPAFATIYEGKVIKDATGWLTFDALKVLDE